MSHEHDHSSPKHPRRWLRWIAAGSVAIGVAEVGYGGAALTVDGTHNMTGDPLSYMLKDAASTQHQEVAPHKVRRRLKIAGYVLCFTSLFGVSEAVHDIANDNPVRSDSHEVTLAVASMAYGVFAARKLHRHGHDLAHSHGVRHAVSDVISSVAVVASTAVAAKGVPYADAMGAFAAASITVGFNFPTEARLSAEVEPVHTHEA